MSLSDRPSSETPSELLQGKRIAFVGRLASMARREAAQLVRSHGAVVLEQPDASANFFVLGEAGLPFPDVDHLEEWPDESIHQAVEAGTWKPSRKRSFGSGWDWSARSPICIGSTRPPCWPSCWACRWR